MDFFDPEGFGCIENRWDLPSSLSHHCFTPWRKKLLEADERWTRMREGSEPTLLDLELEAWDIRHLEAQVARLVACKAPPSSRFCRLSGSVAMCEASQSLPRSASNWECED